MSTMTKEQVFIFNDMIHQIFTDQSKNPTINSRFLYCMKRNEKIAKEAVEKINQELRIDEEVFKKIQEYENKRMAFCIEYSQKDEDNKPIMQDQKFIIVEDKKEEFENKIKELNVEYEEAFSLKMAELQRRENVLKENIDVDFYKIKIDYLPEKDLLTPEMMEVIYSLIDDQKN